MPTVPRFDPMQFNAAALRGRSARHAVLAANLANADTPGYQARDLPFTAVLAQHLGQRSSSDTLPLVTSHARHLDTSPAVGAAPLLYRTAVQPSVDGNTVDPDVERAQFAENTAGFEFAASMLQSTMRSRQMALTGQP